MFLFFLLFHREGCHWSDPRAMIFWQQVIGTVQRGLPVNYVQAFCDGLYTTEEKLRDNNPQGRSLKFQLFDTGQGAWVSSDFYPLSVSRLGFDYAIYGCTGWGDGGVVSAGTTYEEEFLRIMSIKNRYIQTFTPELQNLSPTSVR